jgi:hypothetical protein
MRERFLLVSFVAVVEYLLLSNSVPIGFLWDLKVGGILGVEMLVVVASRSNTMVYLCCYNGD